MGAARTGLPSTVPEVCALLVCSISTLLHGGGLACYHCVSGTYGFGSTGCSVSLQGQCLDGYYEEPTLGSGQQCRPCPCPGHPGSGLYHGICCHVDSAPAATTVPLDALGTLGQGETPEGVHAGPVSATIISIRMTLLPATPTVATASAVCTTAMVPALPTAGLASMPVPCIQGAAVVSVWLGWVRTSQGRWVGSPSSDSSSSPGCSCDPQGTVPARCPSWAEASFCNQVSGQCPCCPHTQGQDCSHCAPLFWHLGGPQGCEPCTCHAQHTVQLACHPVSEAILHIACGSVRV